MVTRSFLVIIVACYYTSVIQKKFPKAMATKIPIDEFMIEDQRTHRKQNYIVQRALNSEMLDNIDNIGPSYATEPFGPNEERSSPEELPSLIVDYANMIRNDIILLDNSVEARTRKRGNIKRYNEAISDPPCSCGSLTEEINLGSNTYPQLVESVVCNKDTCPLPYRCKANYYYKTEDTSTIQWYTPKTSFNGRIMTLLKTNDGANKIPAKSYTFEIQTTTNLGDEGVRSLFRDRQGVSILYLTVLKRKAYPKEESLIELPSDLSHKWIARKVNVTAGCVCARDSTH